MSRFLILSLGLIALVLLTLLCLASHRGPIEGELASRSAAALSAYPGLDVSIEGRDATLFGLRIPAEAPAIEALRGVAGLRRAVDGRRPPTEADLRLSARRLDDGTLELTGLVPDAASRRTIVEQAGAWFGADRVSESLRVAESSTGAAVADAFAAALPFLHQLPAGRVDVTASKLTLGGEAPEARTVDVVRETLRAAVPDTVELEIGVTGEWSREDLRLVASRRGETLVLAGLVGGEAARDELLARAGESWDPERVVDRMRVADLEPPDGFAAALGAALPHLAQLRNGRAVVTPGHVELTGLTQDPTASRGLRSALGATLPSGYEASLDVTSEVDRAECQRALDDLLAGERILFDSDSARIRSESDPLLRRLASALRRCPDFDLRVEGHTDAQASPEHNLHLSRRRAAAVQHRLTGLGIRPGRVAAEGFGESRPVADNETAEGRALNRRIEFKLEGAS